jgi:ATP-dependent Clp protease ATP-binding subunit ClpB
VLLQVLDDGRLTDGQGRTVDFRNTVVIMTSNVEPDRLRDVFRPEFLNRIDEQIVFHPLGREQIARIVELQLAHLRKLLAAKDIEIQLTQKALELVGERGWDPQFGARPLKRAIQKLIQDPLAMKLLAGEVKPGERVEADVAPSGTEITFRSVPKTEAAFADEAQANQAR